MKAFDMKALLAILSLAFSSTAAANPTRGFTCGDGGGCHSPSTNDGQISTVTEIDIAAGGSGLVTFALSGAPADASIGVSGLEATGLNASIIDPASLPTSPTYYQWFDQGSYSFADGPIGDGGTPYFTNATEEYLMNIAVPGDATLGSYEIKYNFAGPKQGGRWAAFMTDSEASFTINVIPIPAAVWLFGSGLIGLLAIARRRRNS